MFRLTKRSVEALEIRNRDYLEWDRDVSGFGVRVYPSGKKTYLIQYRTGRRTRRYTIGSHGVLTADQARAEAKRLMGDVLRGEDPSGTRQDRRQAPTVAALCDRFLKDYAAIHCKPSTYRCYEGAIRLHIKRTFGPMLIEDVTRADVAALHLKLSARAPYQANRVLSLLSKLFNTAEDWGLRAEGTNPARRVKKNREQEKKRYLSDEEQTWRGNEAFARPTDNPQPLREERERLLTRIVMLEREEQEHSAIFKVDAGREAFNAASRALAPIKEEKADLKRRLEEIPDLLDWWIADYAAFERRQRVEKELRDAFDRGVSYPPKFRH